ncbi:hypothetical protein GW17_00043503 [Ensete ventricosum]|nr:hypothetical protein GW17_00043503 [Ensete ventricosum]
MGRPPLRPASLPLLAAGQAAGDSSLQALCSRPPLRASRCKRVCLRATAAPAGWPQPVVPTSVAYVGCCPHKRRRPPLRATALASGASLPCGLALAVADRPLARGLGRGLAVGGRPYMGAGHPSSSLPSLRKYNKNV